MRSHSASTKSAATRSAATNSATGNSAATNPAPTPSAPGNAAGAATSEPVSIAVDADVIAATVWLPAGEQNAEQRGEHNAAPAGVVTVHPATATPGRFYRALAEFITGRGLAAVTYDYRGTCESGTPREFKRTRMRDWMATDVPAVAEWVAQRFPGIPATAIGHSVGGHALTLGYGAEQLERFAIVSSHIATTKQIERASERMKVRVILNVLGPPLSRTLGYMPGKRLGLGEDIPGAAMLEWGRWTRLPRYFFDDPTMAAGSRAAAVRQPVLAIGATDDPWGSPAQVDALTDNLVNAPVERKTYSPHELGVARIGHHGLLRRNTGEQAWPELLDWLTARST